MSPQYEKRRPAQEQLTLADLIAQDPFRAHRPSAPGARTPLGIRPGMRGLRTGGVDGLAPYAPGDDVRMIDWRGFARSGQLRLKEREREAHSAIMLVVDLGPHMRFGTAGGTLAFRAALTAARHAWTALRRDEPIGLAVSGEGILVRPARGRRRLLNTLDRFARAFGTNSANGPVLAEAIDQAAGVLGPRDELWAFSDFHHWSRIGETPPAGAAPTGRRHAVQIDDAVHMAPPPAGSYPAGSMASPDTDEHLQLRSDDGRHALLVTEAAARLNRELENKGWRTGSDRPAQPAGITNVA